MDNLKQKFDAPTVAVMRQALNEVVSDRRFMARKSVTPLEVAEHILEQAASGVRDLNRLKSSCTRPQPSEKLGIRETEYRCLKADWSRLRRRPIPTVIPQKSRFCRRENTTGKSQKPPILLGISVKPLHSSVCLQVVQSRVGRIDRTCAWLFRPANSVGLRWLAKVAVISGHGHEIARNHIRRLGPRGKMNADRARKLAAEAARGADRAEARYSPPVHMIRLTETS
jgi:hypothetical protein